MKNKPLAVQIWYVLAGTAAGILIILLVALPPILRGFFATETYDAIAAAQRALISGGGVQTTLEGGSIPERQQELQNMREVRHFVVTPDGKIAPQGRVPALLADTIRRQVLAQTAAQQRYTAGSRSGKLYYMATKVTIGTGRGATLVSYMWDTYQRQLAGALYRRIILLMAIVTAISWLPSIGLSRYLSGPLVKLQQHVRRIAERDWKEPVRTGRGDEIGQLGDSIERMREQLMRQDELQQSMLQHISHELKTPVMVIHSYAQSILDGVYPKGDLEGSVRVIETEAERLDKRIRDLLYMTKLDYLASGGGQVREPVALAALLRDAAQRLRWRRPELEWEVDVRETSVLGDEGQLTAAVENLLDNQMRYARCRVFVSLHAEAGAAVLRLANDGPELEAATAEGLFQPFHKGKMGQFGLGLSIVQRVALLHGGEARAVNEPPGVAFYVRLPSPGGTSV